MKISHKRANQRGRKIHFNKENHQDKMYFLNKEHDSLSWRHLLKKKVTRLKMNSLAKSMEILYSRFLESGNQPEEMELLSKNKILQ